MRVARFKLAALQLPHTSTNCTNRYTGSLSTTRKLYKENKVDPEKQTPIIAEKMM
ncbi:hypothetical protein [Paenibacillus larvae]|uniref:hypothetical protein n=1 Tax=Paenibacillus larvae TaxID=1464 RepID=UPI002890E077|nr:hypothetical protein [Paenibacillus larvae]MDT2193411.1 hypothetical protein [Paenibacillus larvae]